MSGRGKRNSAAIHVYEAEDERPAVGEESEEEITFEDEIVVKSALRFLIISSSRKQDIDRAALGKYIRETHGDLNRKKMNWTITEAKKLLKDLFNIELYELNGGIFLKNNFERHEIFVDEVIPDFIKKSKKDENDDETMEIDDGEGTQKRKKKSPNKKHKRARIESDDENENNHPNESSNNESMDCDNEEQNSDEDDDIPEDEEEIILPPDFLTSSTPFRTYTQKEVILPSYFDWDHKYMIEQSKMFLLKLILAFIDLKGEEVLEVDLFDYLNDLRFRREDKIDSILDSTSRTIQQIVSIDFPAKSYLERFKLNDSQPGQGQGFAYKWGNRSMIEFTHQEILRFVRYFYGPSPEEEQFWVMYEMNAHKADEKIQKMRVYAEPLSQMVGATQSGRP